MRTTINACRTKHRSVSPQDGFNYSTTRLMAKVNAGFRFQLEHSSRHALMKGGNSYMGWTGIRMQASR